MQRPSFSLTKKAILTLTVLLLPILLTFVYVYNYGNNLQFDEMRMAAIAAGIFAAVSTAFFFILFFKNIIGQLKTLADAAGMIAKGNYDETIPITKDEIGRLASEFNNMAGEIKARSAALKKTEEQLSGLAKFLEENPSPIMRISGGGAVLYANAAAQPLLDEFGVKRGGTLPVRWMREAARAYDSQKIHMTEIGHQQSVYSVTFSPVKGSPYVNLYGLDITVRKKAEFELKKISMALEQSVNIIFITDIKSNIEYVNPMFEHVTGYSRDEALGQTPRILSSGDVTTEQYELLWTTIMSGKTWRSVYRNKKKNGTYYWSNSIISPIKNDAGGITHFLAVQEDVTEKMLSEERIKYLTEFDELTCLTNRAHFIRQMDEWIARAKPLGWHGALLILDVDQFKYFNETYGHSTGDNFIKELANFLRLALERICGEETPARFMLGRLSGDEFAVFLPLAGAEKAIAIAEELRAAAGCFTFIAPISPLTVSIGLVMYPEHGTRTVELFAKADAAMFRAKDLGRNRTHLYIQADQVLEHIHSRFQWKEKILKALREDRIVPWFQPILDLKDGNVHHYEALARMRDEDGRILLPGAFIETAERFGLVNAIDRMIIEKAMRLQAELMGKGKTLSFSINLSGKDLDDENLLSYIRNMITKTGANPANLIFEITETAAICDMGRAKEFVNSLKSTGCLFSLDDFGVGFTSFVYLKELAADYVKIDGSFIRKLSEDKADQAFVKAMVDVSKSLNIKTVAEFVETKETLDILKGYGVDYAQGYLIGKPRAVSSQADTLWQG